MTQFVPASRIAAARITFLRSLAKHTQAIRDLRELRPHLSQAEIERDDAFRVLLTRDKSAHVSTSWMSLNSTAVFERAGSARVQAIDTWAERWKLDGVLWLRKWCAFALWWWEAARWCGNAACPNGCAAVKGDDDALALQLALDNETMLKLEAEDGKQISLTAQLSDLNSGGGTIMSGGAEWVPAGIDPVVNPLAGPHPILETREEFLQRARIAWDEAVIELAQEGHSVIVPRQLERHCDWLVRYHVLEQTAAEIVGDVEDTDPSTVYKAVRALAQLIEIPIR